MKRICFFLLALMAQGCAQWHSGTPAQAFQVATSSADPWGCDGTLARQVWAQWDGAGRAYAQQELQHRLLEQGDTYVLYDLQTVFHNLHALALRCNALTRQRQFADLIKRAYARLEIEPSRNDRRQWVCRGGRVCNRVNRLVDTEVMLTSVQFLALATEVANGLHGHSAATDSDRAFALQTARIALEHLLRWSNARAMAALRASLTATQADVADGSSRYFLTDKVLWQLTVYAHVAGMIERDTNLRDSLSLSVDEWAQLQNHAHALAQLVERRTTATTGGDAEQAALDLDAGYWRYYKDNRYASYQGADKPALCERGEDGRLKAVIKLPPETVPIRDDIGWDLSHARRLVHYLSALQRNRQAMQSVWQIPMNLLPDDATVQGFAKQLLTKVWNQDKARPLFANYLSGANGWYRVAYDNGTGRCAEGFPPFGLTDAFPTGGFVTWGHWVPQLHALGVRLFELLASDAPVDRRFVQQHYPKLSNSSTPKVRMLQQLMFWPSLTGIDKRGNL